MLLEALAEKAAGKRKRMPSHLSGLGKYDPETAELAIVNEHLLHLPTIVAEENAFIEEYRRQLPPRLPRPTPQQAYDTLLAGVQRLLPPTDAPPPK